MTARVISSFGDTFSVAADGFKAVCRARGVLRTKTSILCGDIAEIEYSGGEWVITEVYPRKNEIVRPPIANLDNLVIVCSSASPPPDIAMIDKFTAVAVYKDIDPVIVFTKTDVRSADEYASVYSGFFPVFTVNNTTGEGAAQLSEFLKGKFSALAGNSGVGKSSLINNICPGAMAETGEISRKLGRGRNTTRRTEFMPLPGGGYIADTPGFAAFSTERYVAIFKEDLAGCFPEFREFADKCRYTDCSHTKEQGSAVLEALAEGKIKPSRHRSYVEMYREAEKLKPWLLNKDPEKPR